MVGLMHVWQPARTTTATAPASLVSIVSKFIALEAGSVTRQHIQHVKSWMLGRESQDILFAYTLSGQWTELRAMTLQARAPPTGWCQLGGQCAN